MGSFQENGTDEININYNAWEYKYDECTAAEDRVLFGSMNIYIHTYTHMHLCVFLTYIWVKKGL